MVPFVIGFVIGLFATLGILGFIAVASEERPEPPRPREKPWYMDMEDDGK